MTEPRNPWDVMAQSMDDANRREVMIARQRVNNCFTGRPQMPT